MNRQEKDLLESFRVLAPEQQQTLLDFAEFLAARAQPQEMPEPQNLPRPESETVVQAIKRLRQTFPMIDQSKILHEVSEHMTQHLMMGKPAVEVIDELEIVFRRHYELLKQE